MQNLSVHSLSFLKHYEWMHWINECELIPFVLMWIMMWILKLSGIASGEIDKLTKYVHMIPCVEACSHEDIARYSIRHISQGHIIHLCTHLRLGLLEGSHPILDVVFKDRYNGFHTKPESPHYSSGARRFFCPEPPEPEVEDGMPFYIVERILMIFWKIYHFEFELTCYVTTWRSLLHYVLSVHWSILCPWGFPSYGPIAGGGM